MKVSAADTEMFYTCSAGLAVCEAIKLTKKLTLNNTAHPK